MNTTIPVLIQDQDDPGQWILAKPFFYWNGEKLVEIPVGFVFDFASVPKIFWNIISPTCLGDAGPLKHDWKYKNGITTRAAVDAEFLSEMIADRIPTWKRYAAYFLVRLFGAGNWDSKSVVIKPVPNLD